MARPSSFKRLIAPLVAVIFLFDSCTKAVVVPLGAVDRPERGRTYVVYLTNGSQYHTSDLHMEIDDSLTFTSSNQRYHVRLDEVRRVERIDMDTTRTVIAVSVVAAVLAITFYGIGKAVSASTPGVD